MKKLMVLAYHMAVGHRAAAAMVCAIAAVALGAKADWSNPVTPQATLGDALFSPAKVDKTPSTTALQAYYKCYVIEMAGGVQAVTAQVKEMGFDGVWDSEITKVDYFMNDSASTFESSTQQYKMPASMSDARGPVEIDAGNAYLVVFFSAEADWFWDEGYPTDYLVVGNWHMEPDQMAFNDKAPGTTLGWQSYSDVPEPTSGLLLLLGMAGLALKRKRA